jgi:hypothetical protein
VKTPKYFFLLPGTTGRWWSGGTETFLKLARLFGEHRETEVVVYASDEVERRSLNRALHEDPPDDAIWVFTTGVDALAIVGRLSGRRMVFYAQESGWSLRLPIGLPVLCAARQGMAEIARQLPTSPVFFMPNALDPAAGDAGPARDIDILHLNRKSTHYLRDELVPALRGRCRVEVVDQYVAHSDLLALMGRSKVYLYDSTASFADGVAEGFGLQPLEALVSGCRVVTNLAGGMSDFLDPGFNCQLLKHVLAEDLALCLRALDMPALPGSHAADLRHLYSEEQLRARISWMLPEIEDLPFPRSESARTEIERHLSDARQEANHPLYSEIDEQRRLIGSLQSELMTKVAERDTLIRNLQAELHMKVSERDGIIRDLQGELHAKVAQRDTTIRALQSELCALDRLPSSARWTRAMRLRAALRILRGR